MAFLQGLTALDLSGVGPAARASRILADYGMNVVKVAPVSARGAKQVSPPFHAYGAGRGMQRIRVDLKHETGRAVIGRLARTADAFMESYRPGVAARLGVGYDELKRHNPRIVYCSTTGYGQRGPCASWAGHDLNYLGVAGFLACSGRDAEGRPAIPGATVADSAGGGMQAALAIVAALLNCARTGEGAYLDVSITDGVLNLMSLYLDEYLATGEDTGPNSGVLTGKFAWYGVYATADGRHLTVGAIEPQFFRNLCERLDLAQFSGSQYDAGRQEEMKAAFRARFLERTRDEWVAALSGHDTCVAPVLGIPEVVANPHLRDRQVFMRAQRGAGIDFEQLGPVLAGGDRAQPLHRVRPDAATDTDQVLGAAGFSAQAIAEMRRAGAIE